MEKKLNLHDLFGIMFPGAVLCACVYIFIVQADFVRSGQLDWSATLAMLPVAHAVGLFVHTVGSRLLHEQKIALKLMHDGDSTFTTEFKGKVKAAFTEVFKLDTDSDPHLQTMFNGCYDYVIQQGKGIYVENLY